MCVCMCAILFYWVPYLESVSMYVYYFVLLFWGLNKKGVCVCVWFHEFVPNLCKVYYFISSYCLNTNVMHYLSMEVMCTTFVCKQHE
jgi:hypothetical protein